MTAVKEKIIGAITVMNDDDAEQFWELIVERFSRPSWDGIEEEAPDAIDLQMLEAIEKDPECRVFTKEENIDWNSAG